MTVDGSFVTGAAVAAVLIVGGHNPFMATVVPLLLDLLQDVLRVFCIQKEKLILFWQGS